MNNKVTIIKSEISHNGKDIYIYTLENGNHHKVVLTNLGATILSIFTPDKNNKIEDTVIGWNDLEIYKTKTFGIVGRFANRIAGAKLKIQGKEYQLTANENKNTLHGGDTNFSKMVWDAETFTKKDGGGVMFSLLSRDGDDGFPGNLQVNATYFLNNNNELQLTYKATTDKTTVVNLTNHVYFNLGGRNCRNIKNHELKVFSNFFLPVNDQLIPLGKAVSVKDTPLDYTRKKKIGEYMEQYHVEYDHCYVLKMNNSDDLIPAAVLREPDSGRKMEVFTTQPGMQIYSGNWFNGKLKGKYGIMYPKFAGICLETQHFPDSPNHSGFPSTELQPNEKFEQQVIFKFSC